MTWGLLVELMGLEPTTPFLQIGRRVHQRPSCRRDRWYAKDLSADVRSHPVGFGPPLWPPSTGAVDRRGRRRAHSSEREVAVELSVPVSTLVHMSLTVDLPEEVMRRLEEVAVARGVSVEELAAETLAQVAPIDTDFAATVSETIVEHREILDRLAET